MVTEKSPSPSSSGRRYPPFWEKAIPILLILLGVVIVVMLVVTFAVALGFFPAV